MPTHVLQLLGPSTGGIRTHVGELTRRLRERGWIVIVAGPAAVMNGAGDQTATVAVPTSWNPLGLRRARAQLRPLLAEVDVVHAHGLKAALVVESLRSRPPVVLTIHNLVVGTKSGLAQRVLRSIERQIIRRADEVVVISPEIDQRLDGLIADSRRHRVLPVSPKRTVGVSRHEVREAYDIDDAAPLIVIVARLHPQKDLSLFLRAVSHVRTQVPDVRALIVGDGPDRASIERERLHLDLADAVIIAGFRPNPIDEMNAADVVALSSLWEGSPLVVAECLSIGAPLVSTAVGTVTRHLVDRETARIVAIGDERAFADALIELLVEPGFARKIGAAGRQIARSIFDPESLTAGVEQAYTAAMATSPVH